ncbi:MAG: NnrU family protein [Gammaproteobacteria bacterium]|nr:NnrU family protein [Gammaproteobacteria bacterium]
MWQMLFAGLLFVGAHLGVSSTPLRGKLVGLVGQGGYLGIYSVLALVTLGNLLWVYGEVPRYEYLWLPDPALYWVAKILMPIAFIFMLGGFMVKNPTAVGMEGMLADPEQREKSVSGLLRITRHPFQWSVVLWAGSHIVANGDKVSIVFFSSFAVLSLAGTVLIDRKKAAIIGVDWQPFMAATSNVPFAAIVAGRNRLAVKELVVPVVVGLVGYGAVFWLHEWVSGVRLI